MLDTGVDIPEAVNLVFFKIIRSKTKFFQMIGRGTRLRPDLFGPGLDKEFFYIFDHCQNLEFFNQNAKGVEGSSQESLSTKLFKTRLELLAGFRRMTGNDEEIHELDRGLVIRLSSEVKAMNPDNFIIRPHLEQVEKYREGSAWDTLESSNYDEIEHILAGLPNELAPEDETAKRFDLLMLKLQLALLTIDLSYSRLSEPVKEIASRLEEKQNVPMVREQLELILDLQQDEYWADITLPMLEDTRRRLRDLVKFIDRKQRKVIYSDFQDELGEIREVELRRNHYHHGSGAISKEGDALSERARKPHLHSQTERKRCHHTKRHFRIGTNLLRIWRTWNERGF